MAQPLAVSLDYHPTHRSRPWHGGRRVENRLRAITGAVDFDGKSILDLGCNGGYFSFAVAAAAERVVAVDGEAELIRLNQAKQAELGITNIDFQHALITPEFIDNMPNFDIILFLSVFHHMLCASQAHDWNTQSERSNAMEVIRKLRGKSKILVFEMGYPWEGYDWSANLPPMEDPCVWVKDNIFGADFAVEILQPPHSTPDRHANDQAPITRRPYSPPVNAPRPTRWQAYFHRPQNLTANATSGAQWTPLAASPFPLV